MEKQELMVDGLSFTEEEIIKFENGLPGFENLTQFIITTVPEHEPFHWMHSLDDEAIKFILVNPLQIHQTYDPQINPNTIKEIGISNKNDLLMYVIVTINQSQFNLSTANLLGPILLNINNKKGIQVVLDDGRYSTKHSLLPQGGQ